jgi:hypothetical protein
MNPMLLVGVAFSILLSVILVVIGVDTANSAIIGLVGTTISLLLDLMVRANKMEQNLIKAAGLSREMVGDPQLFAALSSIASDYHRVVGGAPFKLFAERAKDVLSECQDDLHNLVEGYMLLPPLSQFSFGLKGLVELQQTVRATSYVDAEGFWNSVEGDRYFQANVNLVNRGVQITRVFIGDRITLTRFKSIILRHRRAGMRILVALAEEMPRELCEDYLIGDDSVLVQLLLTREGIARAEKISIDPQEIRRAINNFERLVGGAHEYEQLFLAEPPQQP